MRTLAERMKEYEWVWDTRLTSRLPVVLRIDGNSFHRFTTLAKFNTPFDTHLSEMMVESAIKLLQYCSGSTLAFVQSDEISVLLRNDQTIKTQPFLAGRIQKLVSLTASVATVSFYKSFLAWNHDQHLETVTMGDTARMGYYAKRKELTPTFDCRAFVLPKTEVVNYFIWRQQDAYKNCVSSVAEAELKKTYDKSQVKQMLHRQNTQQRVKLLKQHGYDFDALVDAKYRLGISIKKAKMEAQLANMLFGKPLDVNTDETVTRSVWTADYTTPVFTENRDYIESLLES